MPQGTRDCLRCVLSCLDTNVVVFDRSTGRVLASSPYADRLKDKLVPGKLVSLPPAGTFEVDGEKISYVLREDHEHDLAFLYVVDPNILADTSKFSIFGDVKTVPGVSLYRTFNKPFSGDFVISLQADGANKRYVLGFVDIEGSGLNTYEVAPTIRGVLTNELLRRTVQFSLHNLHCMLREATGMNKSVAITVFSIFDSVVEIASAGGMPVFIGSGGKWRARSMGAPPLNPNLPCEVSMFVTTEVDELVVFSDGVFELDVGGERRSLYADFERFALQALRAGMDVRHLVHKFADEVGGRFADDTLVAHVDVQKVRESCAL